MTKHVNKKFAAFAVAAVMTVGGVGIAGNIDLSKKALADTGKVSTYSYFASEGIIDGIGADHKTSLTLKSGEDATVTLSGVEAGQYIITGQVTDDAGEWWIDLGVEVDKVPVEEDDDTPDRTIYFTYDDVTKLYTAVIAVKADSTLTLKTSAGSEIAVDFYLQNLYLGKDNAYSLTGVQIPVDIALNNVEGNFILNVQLFETISEYPTITAQVDEGTPVTLVRNEYEDYTGRISVTAESKTLKLSSTTPVMVAIGLEAVIEVNTPLPTTEDKPANFDQWKSYNFYYETNVSNYYAVKTHASVENADFSILVKTDPNDIDGVSVIGDNFPLYLEAGTRYFFTISYFGEPTGTATSATAWFTFSDWEAPTIRANQDMVYVPVTNENQTKIMTLNVDPGTYVINMTVPLGETVTAHIRNILGAVNSVTLAEGSAQIEINNGRYIWFTTTGTPFSAGVTINTPQQVGVLELGKSSSITLTGKETAVYTISGLAQGYYEVVLTLPGNKPVQVSASTLPLPIIRYGNTRGAFGVVVSGEETTTDATLYFTYNGTDSVTFNVIVNPISNATIALGAATTVNVPANGESTYFLENYSEGIYTMNLTLPEGAKIEVYSSLQEAPMIIEGGTSATFTLYYQQTVGLIFKNLSNTAVNLSVKVELEANGYLNLGWYNGITLSAAQNSKVYLLEDLKPGKYNVTLVLPEEPAGVQIKVTDAAGTVIDYGATEGTITVTAEGTYSLTFMYNGTEEVSFEVLVEAAA